MAFFLFGKPYFASFVGRQEDSSRLLDDAWLKAAKRAQLNLIRPSKSADWSDSQLCAHSHSLFVELDRYLRLDQSGTRIRISRRQHGRQGLSVRRKALGPPTGIQLGDPGFSEEFHIAGTPILALALLDAQTRPLLAQFLRGLIRVDGGESVEVRADFTDGVLEVELPHKASLTLEESADVVFQILTRMLALARRLAPGKSLLSRIFENLRSETEAGVRLQVLSLLARTFPRYPGTRAALLAAREDADDEVRLHAAIAVGEEEGDATLLALISREATEDSCAARAVAALGERLGFEAAQEALQQALNRGHDQTARACIETLENHGRSEAEGPLLAALRSAEPAVTLAAARALARIGTAAAVPPLRALASPRLHRELQAAIRQAIAEIQARLTSATPGQLSLLAGEAGALSLAEAQRGDLTLVEPSEVSRQRAPEV